MHRLHHDRVMGVCLSAFFLFIFILGFVMNAWFCCVMHCTGFWRPRACTIRQSFPTSFRQSYTVCRNHHCSSILNLKPPRVYHWVFRPTPAGGSGPLGPLNKDDNFYHRILIRNTFLLVTLWVLVYTFAFQRHSEVPMRAGGLAGGVRRFRT